MSLYDNEVRVAQRKEEVQYMWLGRVAGVQPLKDKHESN